MYLLILESIGMSELILIGAVALMIFGPRKLPQIARMVGKTMADFRRTTGEFKETWEREVNFEEEEKALKEIVYPRENTQSKTETERLKESFEASKMLPEIREVEMTEFDKKAQADVSAAVAAEKLPIEERETEKDKRNWL